MRLARRCAAVDANGAWDVGRRGARRDWTDSTSSTQNSRAPASRSWLSCGFGWRVPESMCPLRPTSRSGAARIPTGWPSWRGGRHWCSRSQPLGGSHRACLHIAERIRRLPVVVSSAWRPCGDSGRAGACRGATRAALRLRAEHRRAADRRRRRTAAAGDSRRAGDSRSWSIRRDCCHRTGAGADRGVMADPVRADRGPADRGSPCLQSRQSSPGDRGGAARSCGSAKWCWRRVLGVPAGVRVFRGRAGRPAADASGRRADGWLSLLDWPKPPMRPSP